MISILTQERLLDAALGSLLTGVVVFEQRRSIYKSISESQSRFSPQSQTAVYIPKKEPDIEFAHLWKKRSMLHDCAHLRGPAGHPSSSF